MTEVGAYEAKTNLPKLLERVAAGEQITITRHGVPVARLVPAGGAAGRALAARAHRGRQALSSFVLDCSVTMSWCFEDEADAYSDRVLDASRGARILVPAVWPLEVANVLAVAERRKRLAEADSTRFLELLAGLPIRSEETSFGRATGAILSLARELGLSSYDAAYLDLAMRSGVPLATRDRRLMAACRRSGVARFR